MLTEKAYRAFMKKILVSARRDHRLLAVDQNIDLATFTIAVETCIGMPRSLRDRLITTGQERADDLLTLRPGNIAWWRNSRG